MNGEEGVLQSFLYLDCLEERYSNNHTFQQYRHLEKLDLDTLCEVFPDYTELLKYSYKQSVNLTGSEHKYGHLHIFRKKLGLSTSDVVELAKERDPTIFRKFIERPWVNVGQAMKQLRETLKIVRLKEDRTDVPDSLLALLAQVDKNRPATSGK
jgi:hypothetical protein